MEYRETEQRVRKKTKTCKVIIDHRGIQQGRRGEGVKTRKNTGNVMMVHQCGGSGRTTGTTHERRNYMCKNQQQQQKSL